MKKLLTFSFVAFASSSVYAQKLDEAIYVDAKDDRVVINLAEYPRIEQSASYITLKLNGNEKRIDTANGVRITFGKSILVGDVNGDNKITMEDAKLITEVVVGKEDHPVDKSAADVDRDLKVTIADANTLVNEVLKTKEAK